MADVKIQILDNGPILVTGSFQVQDAKGGLFTVDMSRPAALCRCGQSSKKPFCDGSHKTCGFKSETRAN